MTDDEIKKFVEYKMGQKPGEVEAVELTVMPVSQGEDQDRVTFNLAVVHEHEGDQPYHAGPRGSYLLNNKESTYRRPLKVGTDPVKLDLGWVSEFPGMIVIENNAGKGLNRIPEPEQAELFKRQHLILKFDGSNNGLIIKSGRCSFFEPEDHKSITIQSTEGIVPYVIWVFPD